MNGAGRGEHEPCRPGTGLHPDPRTRRPPTGTTRSRSSASRMPGPPCCTATPGWSATERRRGTDGQRFRARRAVVLNPGTAPSAPPIDGLADTPYWTNRDAVKLTELPATARRHRRRDRVRAHAGVRALRGSRHAPRGRAPDHGSGGAGGQRVDQCRVRARGDPRARRRRHRVDSGTPTGPFPAPRPRPRRPSRVDKLLVAAGRRPNLADLGLEAVGLDGSARALETDDEMRVLRDGSPVEGLYAIGDVTGRWRVHAHVDVRVGRGRPRRLLGRG